MGPAVADICLLELGFDEAVPATCGIGILLLRICSGVAGGELFRGFGEGDAVRESV